jgi:hypothetical protein
MASRTFLFNFVCKVDPIFFSSELLLFSLISSSVQRAIVLGPVRLMQFANASLPIFPLCCEVFCFFRFFLAIWTMRHDHDML